VVHYISARTVRRLPLSIREGTVKYQTQRIVRTPRSEEWRDEEKDSSRTPQARQQGNQRRVQRKVERATSS
jgi:hypothetical protein